MPQLTPHQKHIAALTTAAKKSKNPVKVKQLITKIKVKKAHLNWLAQ